MNIDRLKKINVDVHQDVVLSDYTAFRLGGPCLCLVSCQEPQQLEDVLKFMAQSREKFILIGAGSNLLVSDEGVPCTIIRYVSENPLIEQDGTDLSVAASTHLDDLAFYAARLGLGGLNYTTGIPGTVGGAVVGNAGAFGQQIRDSIKRISLMTTSGIKKDVGPEDLGFGYRNSVLKASGDIVLSVRFGLELADEKALLKEREDILNLRKEKHPDYRTIPCAGSFFKNVEPTSTAEKRQAAGWFLEQAGAKQFSCGGASVFEKHANIIIKSGNCTAQDVFTLSQKMSGAVKEKFDLDLMREVRLVGKFGGAEAPAEEIFW